MARRYLELALIGGLRPPKTAVFIDSTAKRRAFRHNCSLKVDEFMSYFVDFE